MMERKKNKETRSALVTDNMPAKKQQTQCFRPPPPPTFENRPPQSKNQTSTITYKNDKVIGGELRKDGCYDCGEVGHIKKFCPRMLGPISQSVNGPPVHQPQGQRTALPTQSHQQSYNPSQQTRGQQ